SRSRRAASVAFFSTCSAVSGPSGGRHLHRWAAAMVEPLLRVEQVSKRFGGLLALDRASFLAKAGCITALIGPNGAGKTTLFSIIEGFASPGAGRIVYDGADITGEPPHRLGRRGLARTLQIVQPFTTPDAREDRAGRGAPVPAPDRAGERRGRRAPVPAGAGRRPRRRRRHCARGGTGRTARPAGRDL